MRLIFTGSSASALPGGSRDERFIEGRDAEELLEAWRTDDRGPTSWARYDPPDFQQTLVDFSGADVELPAEPEAVLAAVVDALGPSVVRLDAGPSFRQGIRETSRRG